MLRARRLKEPLLERLPQAADVGKLLEVHLGVVAGSSSNDHAAGHFPSSPATQLPEHRVVRFVAQPFAFLDSFEALFVLQRVCQVVEPRSGVLFPQFIDDKIVHLIVSAFDIGHGLPF